ncbi:MAG: GIY-YIG nuclease family protein [Acetobacteraceae bacterium]|nr:GIY-YIG nuclease family protein [Acetobacteraceae bacterium]
MANALAGQRAAFTKAFMSYSRTDDEATRRVEAEKMARIILRAPALGFSREAIVQDKSIPGDVEERLRGASPVAAPEDDAEADPDVQVAELNSMVDTRELREIGEGPEAIYAYGYACAPDRLKIGRTDNDVVARVAGQITTSTPDKPALRLVIRTRNCRALEKAIHAVLQYRMRAVTGGGAEWFLTNPDEIIAIHMSVEGEGRGIGQAATPPP